MKKLKLFIITVVISCLFSPTVFAATKRGEELTSIRVESRLLPPNQKSSSNIPRPETRGEALSVSMLDISNDGGGVIGVVAMTILHRDVSWGMTTIYLDRWNEEKNTWDFIEEYITEFPSGNNNGETTALTVSMDITNQPSDFYYRLRGLHEIEFINSSNRPMWEGHTTCTDGVLITKTP